MLTAKDSLNVSKNLMDIYGCIVDFEDVNTNTMSVEEMNQYREVVTHLYASYVVNLVRCYSGTRIAQDAIDWYEFNADFVGIMDPRELNASLEGVVQQELREAS